MPSQPPTPPASAMTEVCWDLPHSVEAAGLARQLTRQTLAMWGITPWMSEDIQLIVSELVTNALVHAHPPICLSLHRAEGCVRGEVFDRGPLCPLIPRLPDDTELNGRGLAMIDALADRWGVDHSWKGTTRPTSCACGPPSLSPPVAVPA